MNYKIHHLHAIRTAFKRMKQDFRSTLFNTVVLAITLAIPLAAYALYDNVTHALSYLVPRANLTVFLNSEATPQLLTQMASTLTSMPNIQSVKVIPKEQAWEQFSNEAQLSNVKQMLNANPLPDAIIVMPAHEDAQQLTLLQRQIAQLSGVDKVILDLVLVEKISSLFRLFDIVLYWIGVLVFFAALIITINTVRLQLLNYQAEVELADLMGASGMYIKAPFYWYSVLQILFSGLLSIGLVMFLLGVLSNPVNTMAKAYGSAYRLIFPEAIVLSLFLCFLAVLGWAGSAFSIRRYVH